MRGTSKSKLRALVSEPKDEHALQSAVLQHLRIYGRRELNWFSIPNEGRRSLRFGARMKKQGMQAGVADICIMLPAARVAWLELKTLRGVQTIEQRAFQAKCGDLGHPYCLARTLNGAIAFLKLMGALR